jgi:hypothetical protein
MVTKDLNFPNHSLTLDRDKFNPLVAVMGARKVSGCQEKRVIN